MKQPYSYLDKDPDANIPKLLDMLEKSDKSGEAISSQVRGIREAMAMAMVCTSPKRAYYGPAPQCALNSPPIALLLQAAQKAAFFYSLYNPL